MAPAASSVVSWWYVNLCGNPQATETHCPLAFLCSLPETAFPDIISSKSGYSMGLPLRLQQIHHYNSGNNGFCILLSSIRKNPLVCSNPFPCCLGINHNKGLYLCSDLQVLICIYVHPLTYFHKCILWQGSYSHFTENKIMFDYVHVLVDCRFQIWIYIPPNQMFFLIHSAL